MISFPFWLDIQFVISAVGVFAFFAAAWFNISSWAARKELKTGLRAAGFLLLVVWSVMYGINTDNQLAGIFSAAFLLIGVLLVIAGYIIGLLQRQPKGPGKNRTGANLDRVEKIVRGPQAAPDPKPAALAAQSDSVPARAGGRPAIRRPLTVPLTPNQPEKVGLRAEALVKLPKTAKRRRARVAVIIIGLLLLFAAGAAAYFLYFNPSLLNPWGAPAPTPEPAFIEEVPAPEPSPIDTPTPEPKPTVTVLDTETGFLNIREGASLSSEVIVQVKPGDVFELLEENEVGDWFKLQIDESTAGWAASRYLEKSGSALE